MVLKSQNLYRAKHWLGVALTVVVAMAWLAQSAHLQLPVEIVKDLSVPFPCQSSGCGCSDAVQCWSSCCCHTDAEKIAWAKANSVQPPQWFLKDLKAKPAKASQKDSKCCCCGGKSKPVNDTAPNSVPLVAEFDDETQTRTVYLDLKQRRKCQGQYGIDQVALYFTSPLNQPLEAILLSPLCVREIGLPPAVTQAPDTPPPQVV